MFGLFSNSATKQFKYKFTETYNFISDFSYKKLTISNSLAKQKASIMFKELCELAKKAGNPYHETFKIYVSSPMGEEISIAEALIIINHFNSHAFLAGELITSNFAAQVLYFAKSDVHSVSGKDKINKWLA